MARPIKIHRSLVPADDVLLTQSYQLLGQDINSGKVNKWKQVWDYISATRMAKDLGMNATVFKKSKAESPDSWRILDILKLSELTGAKPEKLFSLLIGIR